MSRINADGEVEIDVFDPHITPVPGRVVTLPGGLAAIGCATAGGVVAFGQLGRQNGVAWAAVALAAGLVAGTGAAWLLSRRVRNVVDTNRPRLEVFG